MVQARARALGVLAHRLCIASTATDGERGGPSSGGLPRPANSGAGSVGRTDQPGRWNVDRVRCSDLLGASDDDRAAAAMFYYGYLAAKAGIRVIDVGKIDENVGKVMNQCAATPNLTVPQAFRQALRPRRSPS